MNNTIQELLAELSTDSVEKQVAALETLETVEAKEAIPSVLSLVQSSTDSYVRELGIDFLGKNAFATDQQVGILLISLLADDDEFVRDHAALALGNMRYMPAIDALKQRLNDESSAISRTDVLESLTQFREPSLFSVFQHVLEHDTEPIVRRYAADGLWSSVRLEDIPLIMQDIQSTQDYPAIQVSLILAAYTLQVTGAIDMLTSLFQRIEDDDDVYLIQHALMRVLTGQVPPTIVADFPRLLQAWDTLMQRLPKAIPYRDELKERMAQIEAGAIFPPSNCC
jgi:HEAT repeat protein